MTVVVHLTSSGELGGAEWVALDVLAGLRETRPDWQLVLIVPHDGSLAPRASGLGVQVHVLGWSDRIAGLGDAMIERGGLPTLVGRALRSLPAAARDLWRLRTLLRRLRPAVVHAHGFKMQVLATWAAPRDVPVVLHIHDYVSQRLVMSRLLRLRPTRPLVAVAISRSIAEDARPTMGSGTAVHVVYNGVDIGHWTPVGPRLDLDSRCGMDPPPHGVLRVGLVATMARWKGHESFLRAFALVPPTEPVRGYIIGGPIYRTNASQYTLAELRALAAALHIERRVGFSGFVDDPVQAVRALDIVVHASTRPEPFGRVIVEGMATGRAVITRGLGGASELFEDGVSAVAWNSGTPEELASIIMTLARNPPLRQSLGVRGRDRVIRDFSRDAMTSHIIDIYDELLQQRGPGA